MKHNNRLTNKLTTNINTLFFAVVALNILVLIVSAVFFDNTAIISNQYLSLPYNSFSDFFDTVFFSMQKNPYDFGTSGAIYPPFCYLIAKVFSKFIPDARTYTESLVLKDCQGARMLYVAFVICCVLIITFCIIHAVKGNKLSKAMALVTILASTPFISIIDRGNFLLIAVTFSFVFLVFYDSEDKLLREIALISLAVAASVKLYPAVLGLLLIRRGNIKTAIRTVFYGVVVFVVPCFAFNGFDTLVQFIQNLTEGVQNTGLYEGSINGQVDLSTIISTIYRVYNHAPTPEQYAQITAISKYISIVLAVQFVLGSFLAREKWKKVLCLCAVMLVIPPFSFAYCIASYLPAVLLYITSEHKKRSDWLYFLPLVFLIIPCAVDLRDFFALFFDVETRYSVVLENIAQIALFVIIFINILVLEIKFLKNDGIMKFIRWCWGFVVDILNWCREAFTAITRIKIPDDKWTALIQFIKFGFVGVSNTVISTVIYWVMIYFNCNKYLASIVGFVVSVLNSFFWNNCFVFKKDDDEERNPFKALVKTFMSYAATGLVLHNILLFVWTDVLSISDYLAPIINLVVTIPLNFIMNKFWAFRTKKIEEKENRK